MQEQQNRTETNIRNTTQERQNLTTQQTINNPNQANTEEPRRYRQPERQTDLDEAQGDDILYKNSSTLRIASINIDSLPHDSDDEKNSDLRQAINTTQIDIIGIQEVNIDWSKIPVDQRWDPRTKGWWESVHNTVSYNTEDIEKDITYQPGGTIVMSINKAAHRARQREKDGKNLGRWASTLYTGKNNVKLRIVSAYRCCKNNGPTTAYTQAQRVQENLQENKCPRKAFLDDLKEATHRWLEAGEQVIILTDINEHVGSRDIRTWAEQSNIREVFTYEEEPDPRIPTYNRGRNTIDGVFASHSIQVLRKGYCEFGKFPSCHRLPWIDISYDNAFGHEMANPVTPAARRLKTDDSRVCNKWIQAYEDQIRSRKVHQRIFSLEQETSNNQGRPLTEKQQKEYDAILNERFECIKIADKQCRKLHMSEVHSSPIIEDLKKTIELYRGAIKRKKEVRYSLDKIRRLEKRTNIYNIHLKTLETLERELHQRERQYERMKPKSRDLRDTFLQRKAEANAENQDKDYSNVYKQMKQREHDRMSYRRINYVLGKANACGLTKVQIKEDGEIIDITEKEEIERVCMEENDSKYHQTENTPCMQSPLFELLGRYGETEFGQQVLDGTFEAPEGTSQYVIELLKELKMHENAEREKPEPEITSNIFREGWTKIREQTSAGPSGLHFGHLKACSKSDFLSQVESAISHIPYSTGYSPPRWQYALDVMLRKKSLSELIEKLRTIVLCEADFNFNNKVLGRTTMQHAEKQNMIAPEQYGSRAGKSAIEHAVHKRLWYDILRFNRKPGLLCSNDAKSCYDRIIHTVAALAYRRLGISAAPVECMLETIQEMKHHIRTAYGDSLFYMDSSGKIKKFQGLLQGNGASPTTWVIISTPLLNMLRTAGDGSYFLTSISGDMIHVVGFAFVDDTDTPIATLHLPNATVPDIMGKAQEAINRWEGGLKATGGAIAPDKSCAFPVAFKFDEQGKWSYQSVEEVGIELTVKDHQEITQTLEQKEPHQTMETLGTWLAPDGNNDVQARKLKGKAKAWAAHVQAGHLSPKDAWKATTMTIIKSLVYPLPALTLTQKECTSIMAPVKRAGLNAMHISRSYPNDLVFGSKEELGLGITELFTEQGVIHAYYLEKYLDTDTLTGKFLRCEIEAATLELGIGGNIFEYDYNKYSPLLTDSWVKNTWEFFHLHKIKFQQQVTAQLKKEREGDIFIMERIVEQGQLKPTELNEVNRCRQHLQVNTLADIGDGYGEYLTSTYKCNKDTTRETQYNWPTQPRPGIKAIRSWKRNIKRHFLNNENKLVDELGRWYKRPENWTWYIGLQEPHHIYEIRANGRIRTWIRENNYGPQARRKVYIYWTDAVHMSQNIAPATIIRKPNQRIKLTGYAESNNRDFRHFKTPILGDTILLEYASVPDMETTQQIIAAITARILLIISDGSHHDEIKLGAASWLIDNGNIILARGSSRTPGEKKVQGSYRSELHGILSGILHISKILRFYPNVTGKVKYGCDGKGAVMAINDRYTITEINRKNADIITAIWKLTDASPIEWEIYHLHGHQDDNVSFQDLPRDAQLNVLADAAAKQHCNLIIENQQHTTAHTPWLPYQRHRTHHYDKLISGDFKETIRTTIQSKRARQYWINKYDFTEEHTIQIDWELRLRSLHTFPRHKHRWLGKWCSGFCGTNRQNKRYGYQDNTKCPRCPCEMENTTHIIKCPSNDNNEMWNAEMNDLQVWMEEQDSAPEIIRWLLQALDKWRKDEDIELPPTLDDQLHTTLVQQHSIGWKEMMEGYWHKGWRLIQERYWDRKNSKKSPLVWASKLQQRIWYTLWRIWDLRNKIKHGDKEQEHSQERQDLQAAIEQQWEIGISTLPPRYSFLFHGTIEDRLTDTTSNQHKWLASAWSARDFHDGFAVMPIGQNMAATRFNRWRRRFVQDADSDDE